MLRIGELDLFYGDAQALAGVSLEVGNGEIVAIVGANGAGKTSLIRAITGMHPVARGAVEFGGKSILGEPTHRICDLGIGQVPEGRQIFAGMTVRENLQMGAVIPRARARLRENLERVNALFPLLAERRRQAAGTLSGGEQQMLAIGRCLMSEPRLILFDEPSLGLAPVVVDEMLRVIERLNRETGLTVVLVEQNVAQSLALADRGYVLENGRIVLSGTGAELLANDGVRQAYVGI